VYDLKERRKDHDTRAMLKERIHMGWLQARAIDRSSITKDELEAGHAAFIAGEFSSVHYRLNGFVDGQNYNPEFEKSKSSA